MTFPLMDRTRRLTEEALAEAELDWGKLDGVLLVGGSTRMPMVRSYVSQMAGKPPRTGVNVDEVVALGAAIQAAIEVGQPIGDAVPRFTLPASAAGATAAQPETATRKVTDVMSHSLGTIAVSPDGTAYVNDIVVRRNLPIPARNNKAYIHETHGGANTHLEVYLTQGESPAPLDCTILGKYVFDGIKPTDAEVTVDVGLSYDSNGVVQVQAVQRDTGHRLPMTVEPVPDDLSWLGRPPETTVAAREPELIRVLLLFDVSASMTGQPLVEAQTAANEFLSRCDFTTMEVGLISFSTLVALQSPATNNVRRLHAAVHRMEAQGSTNLTDALELARGQLVAGDRKRYIVILTDGYPDAPESAVDQALAARKQGIDIVAIGTGDADRDYLSRLASSEQASIFARSGELVQTFGHIARVIAEGGRALRMMS
jgi:Mg-chelatase subunit ChlD